MAVLFDRFYKGYDEWYRTKMGNFLDTLQKKAGYELLKPEAGDYILDGGCGTGNYTIDLYNKGCNLVGIDISNKMLEKAKNKVKDLDRDRIMFKEMDMYNIDFPDNTFDKAISMTAFEFIKEPKRAFKEMLRVLKPGGILVIGSIQKYGKWHELYMTDEFKDSVYVEGYFYTKEELESLGKDIHVESIETLYTPPTVKEGELNFKLEDKYKEKFKRGGFVCVSFQKK